MNDDDWFQDAKLHGQPSTNDQANASPIDGRIGQAENVKSFKLHTFVVEDVDDDKKQGDARQN